jgi:hypothetical protein
MMSSWEKELMVFIFLSVLPERRHPSLPFRATIRDDHFEVGY